MKKGSEGYILKQFWHIKRVLAYKKKNRCEEEHLIRVSGFDFG